MKKLASFKNLSAGKRKPKGSKKSVAMTRALMAPMIKEQMKGKC